ncbi:MAG: S9 family peptidase, partial [Planctomycetes bacterium]|nr:S9 family peptidase [Planctomycetota bacterium]
HPDRLLEAGLWKVNIDGTDDQEFLRLEGWTLRSPQPSQDGTVVAFVGRQTDEPADRQSQLGLISIVETEAEAEVLWLTDEKTYDYSVSAFDWSGPNIELLFTGPREGGFPLMMINQGLIQPAPVVESNNVGPVGVQAFDAKSSTVIYSLISADNPCVLRVIDLRGDRLVFDLNEWVADKKLSLPKGDWLTRPDGIKVQYWTMEPTNRESGQTYPVCLELHGGPSAMWGPGEFTMWLEFQLLCSWGYGVVYANPRGSGGYGYTHQRANFQDWGDGPTGDVLAALDKMLKNDWADPDRLVVTGGSYAGYLTAYIVGHDHRFKAAVAQRGVYDLQTFFGEGNAWRLARWAMGGYPWETRMRAIYRRESPFTDVHRIRTPLLIMHSSNDLRTGVSQSEMLYRALKELEKPVEYIRYPDAGHDLSRTGDPKQRLDRLNRIIEFFDRHIDNPRPAPQESSTADGQ